ncbi:hypothetical protein EMPS_09084 [Entomortierella parvispora]|uniref:Uncharacterized protein n=1 Tax=Entomortierella parvispora TaxID=205924 RepID=A0A9P3HHC3_9FUNG|nr:hypothetical protein EMPS_09084 [Entomortierella parvispora]
MARSAASATPSPALSAKHSGKNRQSPSPGPSLAHHHHQHHPQRDTDQIRPISDDRTPFDPRQDQHGYHHPHPYAARDHPQGGQPWSQQQQQQKVHPRQQEADPRYRDYDPEPVDYDPSRDRFPPPSHSQGHAQLYPHQDYRPQDPYQQHPYQPPPRQEEYYPNHNTNSSGPSSSSWSRSRPPSPSSGPTTAISTSASQGSHPSSSSHTPFTRQAITTTALRPRSPPPSSSSTHPYLAQSPTSSHHHPSAPLSPMHSASSSSASAPISHPLPPPSHSHSSGPRSSYRSPVSSTGAYPIKRHHLDSDSEGGFSDHDRPEYRGMGPNSAGQQQQQPPHSSYHHQGVDQGRDPYHRGVGAYSSSSMNELKPQRYPESPYKEYGPQHQHHHQQQQYHAPQQHHHHHHQSLSGPQSSHRPPSQDRFPPLASRPAHYATDDEAGPPSSYSRQAAVHGPPASSSGQALASSSAATSPIKKEASATSSSSSAPPFRIQSARGTPKGPLPIDVQISLLTSVLNHDPFNCAIRKTTQAWESISREQGIRARTCSRRFDNIIQASIGGRDRPVGTEQQQAAKKRLLEKLFEMMNQPQALKRMQKKRRYRSEDTDKQLLVETIRLNPFAQKVGQVAKAWEDVRDALKMKVHARQCIRRVNRMVKPYQLRERMYKGDIPEEMREANDDLVKHVIQLMRNAGQGPGALDEGCNSNDEDSASGMSDSEDQEDGEGDGVSAEAEADATLKDELMQEDKDLNEDEDMVSRSESEQQGTGLRQDAHTQPRRTKRGVPAEEGESTPAAAASSSLSPPPAQAGRSSLPISSPAKRGRPRNPVNPSATSSSAQRPSSHSSMDRTRLYQKQQQQHPSTSSTMAWEGEAGFESKGGEGGLRVSTTSSTTGTTTGPGPEKRGTSESGSGYWNQTSGGASMLPPRPQSPSGGYPGPPGGGHSHARMGHARHYSQGDSIDVSSASVGADYRRPVKHARTGSNGGTAVAVGPGHLQYAPSPRIAPSHLHNGGIVGDQERIGDQERYSGGPSSSAPGYEDAGYHHQPPSSLAPPHHHQHHQHQPSTSSFSSSSSSPQYREILNELLIMRDYLGQMDEYRRANLDKQQSMMYQLEKMQIHIQQQQQQISELQQQLESTSATVGPTPTPTAAAAISPRSPSLQPSPAPPSQQQP